MKPDGIYWAETDRIQAQQAKPPYDDVRLAGLVEGRFFYSTALAKHLLPFAVLEPATVLLPAQIRKEHVELMTASALVRAGFRGMAKWTKEAEKVWAQKREEKAGKHNAQDWLDYQGKLTNQFLGNRYLVLYNAAGTNVSAACLDRHAHPLPFVVDHKLYWAAFTNAEEAHYLTAFLNSTTANELIKPFQSTGLLGERDIHKKLLELPIPAFNASVPTHRQLAELSKEAHTSAAAYVAEGFPKEAVLGRQRSVMRNVLKELLRDIDLIAQKILYSAMQLPADRKVEVPAKGLSLVRKSGG